MHKQISYHLKNKLKFIFLKSNEVKNYHVPSIWQLQYMHPEQHLGQHQVISVLSISDN